MTMISFNVCQPSLVLYFQALSFKMPNVLQMFFYIKPALIISLKLWIATSSAGIALTQFLLCHKTNNIAPLLVMYTFQVKKLKRKLHNQALLMKAVLILYLFCTYYKVLKQWCSFLLITTDYHCNRNMYPDLYSSEDINYCCDSCTFIILNKFGNIAAIFELKSKSYQNRQPCSLSFQV